MTHKAHAQAAKMAKAFHRLAEAASEAAAAPQAAAEPPETPPEVKHP